MKLPVKHKNLIRSGRFPFAIEALKMYFNRFFFIQTVESTYFVQVYALSLQIIIIKKKIDNQNTYIEMAKAIEIRFRRKMKICNANK